MREEILPNGVMNREKQNKRVGLKSALRGTHDSADNLIDSVSTLQDGGVVSEYYVGLESAVAVQTKLEREQLAKVIQNTCSNVGENNSKGVRLPLLSAVTVGTTYFDFQ